MSVNSNPKMAMNQAKNQQLLLQNNILANASSDIQIPTLPKNSSTSKDIQGGAIQLSQHSQGQDANAFATIQQHPSN